MRRREGQSGFSATVVLFAVLVVAALAVTGLVVYQRHKPSSGNSNAATNTTQPTTQPKSTTTTQPAQANAGLKQYTNAKYGFSFYYPDTWQVEQDDPAATVDAQYTELLLSLVDPSAPTTQSKTVYFEVSSRDLASKTALFDGSIDGEGGTSANYKQNLTLKNREAVKYTIPQSKTANREVYFFSVGTKTYTVSTTNEDTNIARNPDYMTKFSNLVDSLTLPQ